MFDLGMKHYMFLIYIANNGFKEGKLQLKTAYLLYGGEDAAKAWRWGRCF